MGVKVYEIDLDLILATPTQRIEFRIGDFDTNALRVNVLHNGEPFNLTGWDIYFECRTPDGKFVREGGPTSAHVASVTAQDGLFTYTLPAEAYGSPGQVTNAYFRFEQADPTLQRPVDVVSTASFSYQVVSDAMTGSDAAATHYVGEFEKLKDDVTGIIADITQESAAAGENLAKLQEKIESNDLFTKSEARADMLLKNEVNAINGGLTLQAATSDGNAYHVINDHEGKERLKFGLAAGLVTIEPSSTDRVHVMGAVDATDIYKNGSQVFTHEDSYTQGEQIKRDLKAELAAKGSPVAAKASLLNGWQSVSALQQLTYMKNEFNQVTVYGSITSGTTTFGTILANLPAGFRPGATIRAAALYQTITSGSAANTQTPINVSLNAAGNLIIDSYGLPAEIRLHVISFSFLAEG